MGISEHFPYTNFHDLNLDWIIQELEKLSADVRDFISINAIKYANPIQWDITNQYEKNTVVLDKDGNAYLSVQPVPAGVSLDRTEYWTNIGNFSALWESVKKAITIPDEGFEKTASAPRAANDLVWVDGDLVEVTSPMLAGDQYVIGSNCRLYTMQIFLSETLAALKQEQQAREQAIQQEQQAREQAIQQEQQAREQADNDLKNAIDKTSISSFFKGKRILILGDSNSVEGEEWRGETWVTPFRELLSGIADTIVNNSTSSRRFANGGPVPSMVEIVNSLGAGNYDYIIVYCGVNDWAGQVEIGSVNKYQDWNYSKFADCVKYCMEQLHEKFPAAAQYWVTPIKTNDYATVTTPLLVYSNAIRAICGSVGETAIDGLLAPGYWVNGANPTTYSKDGLHYNDAYCPILMRFIVNAILAGGTQTAITSTSMNLETSDKVESATAVLTVKSDGTSELFFKGKLASEEYVGFLKENPPKWAIEEWFQSVHIVKATHDGASVIAPASLNNGNPFPITGYNAIGDTYDMNLTMKPISMNATIYK